MHTGPFPVTAGRTAWTAVLRRGALITALLCSPTAPASEDLTARPEIQQFIQEMVKKHAFTQEALATVFSAVQIRDDILAAISRPAEAKPWFLYRPIFVNGERSKQGVEFWSRYASELDAAEREFGVAPQYIVGIVGVETRYGRHAGGYRVMDALSTLAFNYPPRSPFFRTQLEEYLVMTREEGVEPLSLKGSYAGAMGQPQFMPSSFRAFAVDFDGDGKRDLWTNTADVVGSVANYFHAHGWRPGAPVVHRATVTGDQYEPLVAKTLAPATPFSELIAKGVGVDAPVPPDERVALLRLEGEAGPEYWVARHNFFVITRYNRSQHYAMAVHQLGEMIAAARTPAAPVSEKPKDDRPLWCPACD